MRNLLQLGVVALVVCMLNGCGNKEKDAVDLIKEQGVLTAAVTKDDQEAKRYEAELERRVLKALADELSVELRIVETAEAELEEAVAARTADVAAGITVAHDSRNTSYSVVYGRRAVFIAASRELRFSGVGDLAGLELGVSQQVGEAARKQFYMINGVSMLDYEDVKKAKSDILSQKTGGYICYEDEARILLEEEGIAVRDIPGAGKEAYAFTAGKDQPRLLGLINQLLTEELMKQ